MDKFNVLLSLLGLVSPFLMYWITIKARNENKIREEVVEINKRMNDLTLELVKLESNKVSKEHLDEILSKITSKIDDTNEKLNKLLGFMEKGCEL